MAWLEKRNKVWKVCYRDAAGRVKRVRGYTDRQATKQMMAKLELQIARGEQGLLDPYKEHRSKRILVHVEDYLAELKLLKRDGHYVYVIDRRMRKLIDECGWSVLGDVTMASFCRWREKPIEMPQVEQEQACRGIAAAGGCRRGAGRSAR